MPAQAQDSSVRLEQRLSRAEMHEGGIEPAAGRESGNACIRAGTHCGRHRRPAPRLYRPGRPTHPQPRERQRGWEPGTVFALENGQQWKVLKGSMKLRAPVQAPEIVLVPGIAGRWFLQVDEDLPKARVYRID
jgi:hypothetical protein